MQPRRSLLSTRESLDEVGTAAGKPFINRLAGGSGALFASAMLQLLFFLMAARALKPNEFGSLSAIWAYAIPFSELVGLGAGDYLIQRVSRQPRLFQPLFFLSLVSIVLCLPVIVALVIALKLFLLDSLPYVTLFELVLSETILARLIALSEQSMIAHGQVMLANLQRVGVALVRVLGGAVFYFASQSRSIEDFGNIYVVTSLTSATLSFVFVSRKYGWPRRSKGVLFITRMSFATHNFGRSVSQSLDRISLSLVLPMESLGIYAAGTRVIQIATIPILALLRDTYSGFFVAGRHGVQSAANYALSLRHRIVLTSIASTVAAATFALLMPRLLGSRYESSATVGVIVAISALPIALQYAAGDVLTGSDRQHLRTMISSGSLMLAFPLMTAFAFGFGVMGAAWANVCVQLLTGLAMLIVVRRQLQKERAEHVSA